MGLYFSGLRFFSGTGCDGFGLPTRSLAISRTVLLALKVFLFFFFPAIAFSTAAWLGIFAH